MWADDERAHAGRAVSPKLAGLSSRTPGADRDHDHGASTPWLESSDDFDDEGLDNRRLGRLLLPLVLLVAMLAGGTWWIVQGSGPGEPDGSLIRAESGPYKVRPEAPGGKTFAGTGDSSYAVSEGESRGAALAGGDAAVAPAEAQATTAPVGGTPAVGVQVGAFMDQAAAEAAWAALVQRHPFLSGRSHRVVAGPADTGLVYRLQALAGSDREAGDLCRTLKSAGQDCHIKR
jgi:hypothetical protein